MLKPEWLFDVLRVVNDTHTWAGAILGAFAYWFFFWPRDCHLAFQGLAGSAHEECSSVIDLGFQLTSAALISGLIISIAIGALLWWAGDSIYKNSKAHR